MGHPILLSDSQLISGESVDALADLAVMVLSAYAAGHYLRQHVDEPSVAGFGYLLKERVGRVADFLSALEVVAAAWSSIPRW